MGFDNVTVITGNLGRDPELRFTQSGQAVLSFSVGSNRRFQRDGEWEQETTWFDVTCWAQLAENMAATLTKGTRVICVGRMQQRSWEDKEGNKRTAWGMQAEDVGASLKYATAQIDRTERTENRAGGSTQQRKQYEDEEPF